MQWHHGGDDQLSQCQQGSFNGHATMMVCDNNDNNHHVKQQ